MTHARQPGHAKPKFFLGLFNKDNYFTGGRGLRRSSLLKKRKLPIVIFGREGAVYPQPK